MGEDRHLKRASRLVFSVFIGVALVYLVYFLPLPYYIFMPGTAEPIRPMVEVSKPVTEEKGSLMLTTVRVSDATVFGYLGAFFQPYEELHKKEERFATMKRRRSIRSGRKLLC
ncbi:hypothetical protein LJK87_15955 [Paenibacillus sp. P25]|nr:hypothetical protein LJK87_15955 [Paenibacillus sp. P25]